MMSTDGGVSFAPQLSGIHASVVKGFASAKDGTLYSLYEFGPAGVYRRDGDTWSALGNANLNAVITPQASDIATAPSDASLVYVITHDNQLVRSIDGGMSWSSPAAEFLSSGAYPNHAVVDPADPNVAYASSDFGGLWKTGDRGATWSRIGLSLPSRIDAVGIDSVDSRVLYVVGTGSDGSLLGILKSVDGGLNWDNTGVPRPGQILGFTFHPTDKNTVYAYSGFDVLKTSDGGAHWAQVDFGAPYGTYVPALAVLIDPVIPSTMFVVSSPNTSGFLRSVDSGATWETFRFSVPQGDFLFPDTAALDPLQPGRMHVSVHGLGITEYEVAPDLGITLQGLDSAVPVFESRSVHVQVRNLSFFAASPSEVEITLPSFLTTTAPASCSFIDSVLHCKLPALRAQTMQEIEFSVTAGGTPSTGSMRAKVKSHEADSFAPDDEVVTAVTTVASAPSKSEGGGGGGGGFDWLISAYLILLFVGRKYDGYGKLIMERIKRQG